MTVPRPYAHAFTTHLWPLVVALSIVAALPAHAQTCTPTLVGVPTGPQHVIAGDFPSSVYDLTVYDDGNGSSLIAGGLFLIPPSTTTNPLLIRNKVARYQHGQWTAMDNGLPIASTTFFVTNLELIDLDSSTSGLELFAAGNSGQVYAWNPATGTWSLTGPGLPTTSNTPATLLAFQDAQGPVLLAASSYFNGVMAWRGTGMWQPYAPLNMSGLISRLRVIDEGSGPTLIALGTFHDTGRNIHFAARLVNGQWEQYPIPSTSISTLTDITRWDDGTHGPETYLTGTFCVANGCNIARFRDGTWQAVLGGFSHNVANNAGPNFFQLDEGSGLQLYVGGRIIVPNQFEFLARITPTAWQAPVFLSQFSQNIYAGVSSMVRFDDGDGERTYIAGGFHSFRFVSHNQFTPTPTYSIIRSAPGTYESLAQGLGEVTNSPLSTIRYDLIPLTVQGQPRLFAGGPFARAGGLATVGAALFDGERWSPLSMLPVTGSTAMQGAAIATINGVERIVACAPSSQVGPVAYWDGAAWVRLTNQFPVGGQPTKLISYNNELYALTTAGLQRYSNGSWTPTAAVGSAMNAILGDLGQGQRIYFTASGPVGPGVYEFDGVNSARVGATTPGTPQNLVIHDDGSGPTLFITASVPGMIAKQTATGWTPLGTGVSGSSTPIALASFDDGQGPALYAAGTFTMAGGVATPGFAKWKDNAWHTYPVSAVPPPTTNGRHSMAVFNDRLYVAGEFINIGMVQADHLAYIQACPRTCLADYNGDSDIGTDADIDAFFRCLAGDCCTRCTPDFNNDGDIGDDADIESFFRVLAGGAC